MEKVLAQVLGGGVGYFWISESSTIPPLVDETARAGAIRHSGDVLEIDLLHDDPLKTLTATETPLPTALLGATEHTGVLVLDVGGRTMNTNMGGSKSSVERFRAQTLVAHPAIVDMNSANVTSVSGYFQGNAFLTWAEFDAFERKVQVDANNRVKSASIELKATDDVEIKLTSAVNLRFSGRWSFRDNDDQSHVIETALEIELSSAKPAPFRRLLLPLLRCQEFLSIAFGGLVVADGGRIGCDAFNEKGHLWNSTLMPDVPASHVPIAKKNQRPLFGLDDLGGVDAFARWIRLCKKHPRAVSPIVNLYRRGAATDDVRLLELASAIEYWVAAHRRTSGWTQDGDNYAEAVARHVGPAFATWSGDTPTWASRFWHNYTMLKHDPSFVPDPWEAKVLQDGAYLVLLAELLNRISGTKRPGSRLFADFRHRQLSDWTRTLITTKKSP